MMYLARYTENQVKGTTKQLWTDSGENKKLYEFQKGELVSDKIEN